MDFKLADGEARMICPFNKAHLILKQRMATHLTQCCKNYPASPFKLCPFNGLHYCIAKEFDAHVKDCPDRIYSEKFVHPTGPSAKDVTPLIVKEATACDEDWDEIETASYLEKRSEIINNKPIFLTGKLNEGKAARKAYLKSEKLRLQSLETQAPADMSSTVGGAMQKRAGRGRGTYIQ